MEYWSNGLIKTQHSKLHTPVFSITRCSFLLRAPANHGAHVAGRAGFGQGRLEDLMNFWILVFVFDLPAALFDVDLDGLFVGQCDKAVAPAIPAQSEVASGIGAGVKMLVKPLVRRHHDAAWFPVDANHFAVIGGQSRE